MARGGTGDVLTGLVGGLLAQAPAAALDMTLLGAWMHAEAGRRAALARGRGLHSADLIDFIPEVWKLLEAADQDPEPWR
jgi:NAD(P)H-hydrate epimerase